MKNERPAKYDLELFRDYYATTYQRRCNLQFCAAGALGALVACLRVTLKWRDVMTSRSERTSPAASQPTLSGQLNRLFEVQRPPQAPERTFTNREVIAACKASGRELSESHLSELRRGVKTNPTVRTLEAIAWFFEIRIGYFTDPDVAAEVEAELAVREKRLRAKIAADRRAREELRAATEELQQAMRESGVTKVGHRGTSNITAAREQAAMMRALARALRDDEDDEEAGGRARA